MECEAEDNFSSQAFASHSSLFVNRPCLALLFSLSHSHSLALVSLSIFLSPVLSLYLTKILFVYRFLAVDLFLFGVNFRRESDPAV